MKKRLLLIILVFTLFSWLKVYAAPIVYPRTANNLLLPSDVDFQKINVEEVLRVPAVDAKAKIYDFADLLTEAEESSVYIQLNEFINNTGLDAAIVTTNDLAGFTMNDYSYHFYDYNDFKDVGVLFLIYVNEESKSIYMANNGARSSEVFTVYTDNRVNSIVKYVYENHVQQGDYVGACETFIKLCDGFYIKSFGTYHIANSGTIENDYPWLAVIAISFVLSFILVVVVISRYQKPEKKVDMTLKKAVNMSNMIVKLEYDKPASGRSRDVEETTKVVESEKEETDTDGKESVLSQKNITNLKPDEDVAEKETSIEEEKLVDMEEEKVPEKEEDKS